MNVTVEPAGTLRGEIRTPGDKSISHRALLISALAEGESTIEGLSDGEDVRGTLEIIRELGATVSIVEDHISVRGLADGLHPSDRPLECGNSGTTMRLLAGVLGNVPGEHHLQGDPSLSQRPMDRVAAPLRAMGIDMSGLGPRMLPPLRVTVPRGEIRSLEYTVPVPSAQVKSAVLFAGLAANGVTEVAESVRTRANTEEMLQQAGITVVSEDCGDGRVVQLHPGRPQPHRWRVPGDPSQAAFFIVLGAIHADAAIEVVDLYDGPERLGFLDVLERMGAAIARHTSPAGVTVRSQSSDLVGTTVESEEIPSVDEVPILAVAAAAATGTTRFRDVAELRIKESNRLTGTIELLRSLGVTAREEGDDLVVEGAGSASTFHSFEYHAALDHRMVMSAAVAAAAGRGGVIHGAETVSSSFPIFFDDLASLR